MSKLPKNVGWSLGTELRESHYVLSAKNSAKIQKDMIFHVCLGGLSHPSMPGMLHAAEAAGPADNLALPWAASRMPGKCRMSVRACWRLHGVRTLGGGYYLAMQARATSRGPTLGRARPPSMPSCSQTRTWSGTARRRS